MKILRIVTAILLLYSGNALAEEKKSVFPEACQEACISPFGEKLGATKEGIESFSNCKPACVYENPTFVEKNFAGIQWQCVEFVRRWLMVNRGLTFESIDVAADLWNKIDHLVNFKTKANIPLSNHLNGSEKLPVAGDILVYGREFLNTGHMAIVTGLDKKKKIIFVAEQNFSNKKWPGNFARAIPYVRHDKGFWLLDPFLIGWKSY
ncbi:MAG: CHAP domain-containing protein [Bdellovibrionota bacterium]